MGWEGKARELGSCCLVYILLLTSQPTYVLYLTTYLPLPVFLRGDENEKKAEETKWVEVENETKLAWTDGLASYLAGCLHALYANKGLLMLYRLGVLGYE